MRSGPWAAVLVSFVVTTGTFLIVRQTLKLNHEETLQAADAAMFDDQQLQGADAKTVDIFNGKQNVKMTFREEMTKRFARAANGSVGSSGRMRFAGGVKVMSSIDTVFGWLLIVPLAITRGLESANANGCGSGSAFIDRVVPELAESERTLPRADSANRLMGNHSRNPHPLCTLWQTEMGIARHHAAAGFRGDRELHAAGGGCLGGAFRNFYGAYKAGRSEPHLLREIPESRGINDGELSVSESYTNLGKHRQSKFGLGATVMLSDRVVKNVPGKWDLTM